MSAADLPDPDSFDDLVTPPGSVQLSFWLWYVEAVFALAGAVFVGLSGSSFPTLGYVDGELDNPAALYTTVALIVVLAIARIVVIGYMRRGRTWARNTLVVLGIFGLLGAVVEISANVAVGVAHPLFTLVALVAMLVPASNAYFRARRHAVTAA
ncbi:MAG: hypothetical protein JWR01_1975 [Subtercola sp.]|nr:hypothetical protein [Subtercola sp.]